jgi:hypothetical protein
MDLQLASPPAVLCQPRSRDHELVSYVGRHGVVSIRHVMAALGVGQASAYRRVAACIDRGLLERLQLLRREPVPVVSPGAVDHWLRCASTTPQLAAEFGPERVITERELRLMERLEGRPIASAKLGELPSGHPRLHRPDLVVFSDHGVIAVEVELTPKAPRRLLSIVRAWRGTDCVAEVRYLCEPGSTRRAVDLAIEKTYAEPKVRAFEVVAR